MTDDLDRKFIAKRFRDIPELDCLVGHPTNESSLEEVFCFADGATPDGYTLYQIFTSSFEGTFIIYKRVE